MEIFNKIGEAELKIKDKTIKLPLHEGSEHELGIDISKLRQETGAITLDPGYGNTGACTSVITYIDGDQGILMFTVMFAIGRMPGWIAQWKEMHETPEVKINRPRQIYTGLTQTAYVPINSR